MQSAKCCEPLRNFGICWFSSLDLKFCTLFNSLGSTQVTPVYEMIIYLSCGERYEDTIDDRSYTHNSAIKPTKIWSGCEFTNEFLRGLKFLGEIQLYDSLLGRP